MPTNKPKILYVITQGEWGGAQRYVYDIATKIVNDFDVYVAIGEKNEKNDLQKKLGNLSRSERDPAEAGKIKKLEIIKLKHLKRAISPIHDILAIFELAKLYKTLKPDIIHLNSSKAGIIGSFAKIWPTNWKLKIENWKLLYTVHGWVFNEPTRKLGHALYRWLERLTAKLKDKIIVLSDRDLNDGLKLGIDEKKLVKIPLGIAAQQFINKQEAREALAKITNYKLFRKRDPVFTAGQITNFLIGTIANLYPSKGLDTLIEAVKIQNTKYSIPNTKYIIIGEGPERKNLELRIRNYELENKVYLIGAIDNAARYLKAFDLFVLPSRKEGLPYTILEAVAAEIPIVATDVGGVAELVENTVPPNNQKKLAEAIVAALDNPPPIKNNTLTIEKMVEETRKIYVATGFLLEFTPYCDTGQE